MKGFLRKVMLIATLGATLTFFGCQKDYTDDINKVREDLTAALEQQKSDLEQAINDAKQEAQASADAAEQAAKDYADGLLEEAEDYADAVAKRIADSIKVVILDEVQGQIDDLVDRIEAAEGDIDDLNDEISRLDGRIDALSNDIDGLENRIKDIEDLDIDARLSDLEEFKTEFEQIFATMQQFKEWVDGVDADLDQLRTDVDDILSRLQDVEDDLSALDQRVSDNESAINDIQSELDDLRGDFDSIKDAIAAQISEALLGLETKIGNRLTSISLIPELYIDGIPAIRFESIYYSPASVDDETETIGQASTETFFTGANVVDVRYHLSPAHVELGGIGSYEYLLESADVITKAAVENNIIDIKGIDINDDNELVVSVAKKANTATISEEYRTVTSENEYSTHTAALRLGIADELLYEGETDAYVTSEYSMILERANIAHIAPLIDESRDIDAYNCEGDYMSTDAKFSVTYNAAKSAGAAKTVDFDSELDLLTMVTSCLHYSNEEGRELTKEDMEKAGLAFRFVIPTAENLVNGIDQQPLMKFKDGSETVVVANVPEGSEELDESLPIVRVELIDTNNEDAIIDVQWFKLRWVNKVVPETDLGVVATFNYWLGCVGASNTMNWQQINDSILVKLGKLDEEGVAAGISYEDFDKYYILDDNSINVKLEAVGYELSGDNNDIKTYAVDYNSDLESRVLLWNVRVGQIGNVIDEILENGKVTKQIKITVAPRTDMTEFAGEFSFTLSLDITLEDLPAIYGWNNVSSWTVEKELARIDPVGFSDATNTNPGTTEFVRYNFSMLSLFNSDDNRRFITNMYPTTELTEKYSEQGYNIENHWNCRAWDMQFSATQPEGLNYAPAFASMVDTKYATNADGHYLRRDGQSVSSAWFDTPSNPWYKDAISYLNMQLASESDGKDYQGALALLNDINVAEDERIEVSVDIWSRINQYNYYLIHNFNVWFVSPVTIPAPVVDDSFEDINMNPSTVTLPIGEPEGIVDFQGSAVDSEDKYKYYGIDKIAWDSSNILVDVVEVENVADGSVNLEVDPTLDANNPEDRARMTTAADCHFTITFEEGTGKLTVTNTTGQSLRETCHIWIKATYGHAYGETELWYSIPYVPNQGN